MVMKIYQCKPDKGGMELEPILRELGVAYEDALKDGNAMARVMDKVREASNMTYTFLPISNYLMASCLGTRIRWDPKYGDRVAKETFTTCKEAASFLPEDIRREPLEPLFKAMDILKSMGSRVIVSVTGPVTLLSFLIPLEEIYKAMAKRGKSFMRLLNIMEEFSAEQIRKLDSFRPELIYFVDTIGTLDLVGPALFKKVSGPSYLSVLKRTEDSVTPIYMCPKNMTSLFSAKLIKSASAGKLYAGPCLSRKFKDLHCGTCEIL